MVKFSPSQVRKFVAELKEPDKLLRGSGRFHEMEPRDIIYVVARQIILQNSDSKYHIMAGIKVLLLTWNAVYIQRRPEEIRLSLEDDLLRAYRELREDLDLLRDEKLETIDLSDPAKVKAVKRILKTFSDFESIGPTGASKAIHLINPGLFMMWDGEIRTNHHRIHPLFRVKEETREECYVEFMKTMKEVASSVLQRKTFEEIVSMYWAGSGEPRLREVFPRAAETSLPKLLDECNYVKFRLGQKF